MPSCHGDRFGYLAKCDDAERLLADRSALVRGAAVWALARLAPARLREIAARREAHSDPTVEEEWTAALS